MSGNFGCRFFLAQKQVKMLDLHGKLWDEEKKLRFSREQPITGDGVRD